MPQQGVDPHYFAVDILTKDMARLGYTAISLRSGNKPAILKLLRHAMTEARIKVESLEQVLEEHPNPYDHAGNGEIEAAVKQLSGTIRTNKLDLGVRRMDDHRQDCRA